MAFSDSVVYVVELVLFCDFCYANRSCQLLLSGKLNLSGPEIGFIVRFYFVFSVL